MRNPRHAQDVVREIWAGVQAGSAGLHEISTL